MTNALPTQSLPLLVADAGAAKASNTRPAHGTDAEGEGFARVLDDQQSPAGDAAAAAGGKELPRARQASAEGATAGSYADNSGEAGGAVPGAAPWRNSEPAVLPSARSAAGAAIPAAGATASPAGATMPSAGATMPSAGATIPSAGAAIDSGGTQPAPGAAPAVQQPLRGGGAVAAQGAGSMLLGAVPPDDGAAPAADRGAPGGTPGSAVPGVPRPAADPAAVAPVGAAQAATGGVDTDEPALQPGLIRRPAYAQASEDPAASALREAGSAARPGTDGAAGQTAPRDLFRDGAATESRPAVPAPGSGNSDALAQARGSGAGPEPAALPAAAGTTSNASGVGATSAAVPAPSSGTAPAPLPTAAAATTAATPYGLAAALAPDDAGFSADVSARMQTLIRDGIAEARLQLHPAELGRLHVTVSNDGDQTRLLFVTETAAARDAIEQSMPRLRELLEQSGLQLAQADVGQREREQQAHGSAPGQPAEPIEVAAAEPEASVPHTPGNTRIDTYI